MNEPQLDEPKYQPTPEELAGESWAACYGGSDQFPLRPMEGEHEHPQ